MLDLIRGAETVLADIGELSLDRRFQVVVLEALLVGEAQLDAELDAAGLRRRSYLDDAGHGSRRSPSRRA
jgi:hypothetical protein